MHTFLILSAFLKAMTSFLEFWPGRVATHAQGMLVMFMLTASASTMAQEVERDLERVHVTLQEREAKALVQSGGGGLLPPLALPFVDDFAWPSMRHEASPTNLKRWESSPVRRTMTLAYQPPTLGCATLDGLDDMGNPYELNGIDAEGYADTLTSRRLLLGTGAVTPSDSVALTFWYQCGGIANGADPDVDSLIVEFRNTNEDNPWVRVWSTTGIEDDSTFHPIAIVISATEYFHNDFQFRFRNYGSTEGNVDTWHLDFVKVAAQGLTPAPENLEIAFVNPPTSFLKEPWTALPWQHVKDTLEWVQASTVKTLHRSFGENNNTQGPVGLKVQQVFPPLDDTLEFEPLGGVIPNISVTGLFETDYIQDVDVSASLFESAEQDTFVTFHVSLWEDQVGEANLTSWVGSVDNDSLVHVQAFKDYYAYDDGSAEKAYALESGKGWGEVMVGFDLFEGDTLDGVWIQFTPFFDDAVDAEYVLKCYGDDPVNPGQPTDSLIFAEESSLVPNYYADGGDGFTYVPFDNPAYVEGRIYVGYRQTGENRINIGLDKTTDTNPEYTWFRFPGYAWQQSEIQGSLMIRPAFRAGKQQAWDHVVELRPQFQAPILFPNPGRHEVEWMLEEPTTIHVLDLSGRSVALLDNLSPGLHSWECHEPGMYLFVGTTSRGVVWTQRWICRP